MVVVRLDRVTFSVLEVMVKLEPGSVVFMLSQPWMEKNNIRQQVYASMLLCACIWVHVFCVYVVSLCQSATVGPCFTNQAYPS